MHYIQRFGILNEHLAGGHLVCISNELVVQSASFSKKLIEQVELLGGTAAIDYDLDFAIRWL
jgi:hypothetical protein